MKRKRLKNIINVGKILSIGFTFGVGVIQLLAIQQTSLGYPVADYAKKLMGIWFYLIPAGVIIFIILTLMSYFIFKKRRKKS